MNKIKPYLYSIATTVGVISAAALVSHTLVNGSHAQTHYPTDTATATKNAHAVLSQKCADCHGAEPAFNSFVNLLSLGRMRRDIDAAQRSFIIGGDKDVRDGFVDFMKMDRVLRTRRMPPALYSTVHLGSRLTPNDVAVLRAYYRKDVADKLAYMPVVAPAAPASELERLKIYLGHKLYVDTRLSSDNTISCASCHDLTRGGTDNKPKSEGVKDAQGRPQFGGVNAPTVYNAKGNIRQFWDGRAADLKAQAGGPPLNPVEMGYAKDADWEAIAAKLAQDPELVELFKRVYGDAGITCDTITDAIAAFEETLVTPDSDADRYTYGDKDALTAEQVEGRDAFLRYGCASCHAGAAMGGLSFEYIHTHAPFHAHMPEDCVDGAHGHADHTGSEKHRDMFRVPTLRNVALTYPYFHTGAVDKLEDAVRIMFNTQVGADVSDATVKAVTRFLEAQTGRFRGKKLDELTPEDVQPRLEPAAAQEGK